MKIIFATCEEKINGTADDHLLRDELIRRGHEVEYRTWSDKNVSWSLADAVLIRSTWDYHRRLSEFQKWASKVHQVTRLFNPERLLRWNSSKAYLAELSKQGLPTIPSDFVNDARKAYELSALALQKHSEIILKPSVSATAELTFRTSQLSEVPSLVERILARGEVLIQPFVSSISQVGEISLIYFTGENGVQFSHSVQKVPAAQDFRVQMDFGGRVGPADAPKNLVSLGVKVIESLPYAPLYTRVDIVDWQENPMIGEIEVIEPELFFRFSALAAANCADALCFQLNK